MCHNLHYDFAYWVLQTFFSGLCFQFLGYDFRTRSTFRTQFSNKFDFSGSALERKRLLKFNSGTFSTFCARVLTEFDLLDSNLERARFSNEFNFLASTLERAWLLKRVRLLGLHSGSAGLCELGSQSSSTSWPRLGKRSIFRARLSNTFDFSHWIFKCVQILERFLVFGSTSSLFLNDWRSNILFEFVCLKCCFGRFRYYKTLILNALEVNYNS